MALNKNPVKENPAVETKTAEQPAPSQTQPDANALNVLNALSGIETFATVSSQGNPENLDKAIEMLEMFAKKRGDFIKVKVIDDSFGLLAPVVVLVDKSASQPSSLALVFEGHMAGPLEDRHLRSDQGVPYVLRICAHKLIDDVLKAAVKRTALELVTSGDVVSAGEVIVGKHVDITSSTVMANYFNTALLAFMGVRNISNKSTKVTAASLANNQLALTANYSIEPGTTDTDPTGMPVASDFSVVTSVAAANRKQTTLHDPGHSVVLAKTNAIVDLVYQPQQRPDFGNNLQACYPGYHKHVIATNIEAVTGGTEQQRTENIMTFFYAMASLVPIENSMQAIFDPRYIKKPGQSFGKSSFGALGYEYWPYTDNDQQQPGEIELVHGSVDGPGGEMSISRALHAFTHPGAVFSADLEIGGRASWYNNVIVSAACGVPGANETITGILNNFFGNDAFAKKYSGPIFMPNPVLIELGISTNEDGTLSDTRSIDYTTVLSHVGATDEETIKVFADSQLPGTCTDEARDKYRKIVSGISNNVEFISQAFRVTFAPAALKALLDCYAEANLAIKPEGLVYDTQQTQRGGNFVGANNVQINSAQVFRDTTNVGGVTYAAQAPQSDLYGLWQR